VTVTMAAPEPAKQVISEYKDIPVYLIADPTTITRVELGRDAMDELAQSIRERGILVPLIVRQEGDHYRLVDGHRRLIAAKVLQLETVPCRIIADTEAEALLDSIIANNVREDNTPYEIMQAALMLSQKFTLGVSAIAAKLGKSEGYIRDLLSVAGLPGPLHEKLHSGELSVPAAKELLRLETPMDQLMVGRDFAERRTSGVAASHIIDAFFAARERQKNLTAPEALEVAKAEPLFTCGLCGYNKPLKGQQGLVVCADCYRDLMFLWEAERRRRQEQPPVEHKWSVAAQTDTQWNVQTSPPAQNPQPKEHATNTQPPP